ncbi:MAG: NnrS family protein, partial [Gammaproteobacteria bacterium]|nr:NnrS family protein [Gammaproteobacteria bacterium]
VTQPSALINVAQWLLLLGAITRVVLPVVLPGLYTSWILTSQLLWITGFAVFIWANYPLLTKPRIDGAEG